jgi:glutaredoxin-related protein
MQKIILYSNHCPRCQILKTKLDEQDIVYETCSDINIMVSKGFKSTPILEVNGEIMDFSKAIQWVMSYIG